jgi:excisionase family DNA binding protein
VSSTAITPRYITVPQATKMFSVSKFTIYTLHKHGSIRMLKAGRRTLVDVASFEEHLHRNPVVRHGGVGAH